MAFVKSLAKDIFQGHDSGIDQHANGDHQAHHGDQIEGDVRPGLPHEIHDQKHGEHADGNGRADDERAAEVAEKNENRNNGQQAPQDRGLAEAGDAVRHVDGPVAHQVHAEFVFADFIADGLEFCACEFAHVNHVGGGGFLHFEGQRGAAVETFKSAGFGIIVRDVGNIAQGEVGANGQFPNLIDGFKLAHAANREAFAAFGDITRRDVDVVAVQGAIDGAKVEFVRGQGFLIDFYEQVFFLQALEYDTCHALEPLQSGQDRLVVQIDEFLFVFPEPGEGVFEHRKVFGIKAANVDAIHVIGQVRTHLIQAVADVDADEVHVCVHRKFHPNARARTARRGTDSFDTGHRAENLLDGPRDEPLDFLWRRRGIIDRHKNARECQAGQVFERQPEQGNKPHHHNTDRDHNGADRLVNGKFAEFHNVLLALWLALKL